MILPFIRTRVSAVVLASACVFGASGCDAKKGTISPSPSSKSSAASSAKPGDDIITMPASGPSCEEWKAKPNQIPPPADVAGPPADVPKLASGLATKVLEASGAHKGDGGAAAASGDSGAGAATASAKHPGPRDIVRVHYTGWTKTGVMFDSSVQRGEPTAFPVDQVIKGWTEGMQLMTVGEKRRFWIPAALGYGDTTSKQGPCGDLVFDVELLEYQSTPDDLATPPSTKTTTGIAYKVLHKGPGTQTVKPTDTVTFHMSGWTTDGQLIKSTFQQNKPVTAPVAQLPKGLLEALQVMKVGDKYRLWIPVEKVIDPSQAGQPGAPTGNLVFEMDIIAAR